MYVRNAWYVASFDTDLKAGEPLAKKICGEPLVFYLDAYGQPVCLEDRCVHRLAPLSKGRIEADGLRCMYHGLLFNSAGKCIEIPGQDLIPDRACVRRYPAAVKHGWLWVWMGEPAEADADLIPYAHGFGHPDWLLPSGTMVTDANFMLLNNNLCDLGHLSYVHAASFGADEQWIRKRPKITSLDRGVRFERWLREIPPIPPLGEAARHDRIDMWSAYDFVLPGLFLFYNAMYPSGSADRYGNEAPAESEMPLFEHYTQQSVTPIDERTTFYTFGWGPSRRLGTEHEAALMFQTLGQAFQEDKEMIEAQQRIIDLHPDHPIMPTAGDKGVVLFNRLMEGLIRAEQNATRTAA